MRQNNTPVADGQVKARLAEHHVLNGVTVSAMGNHGTDIPVPVDYPAGFTHGIIAVGAVDRNGNRWLQSSTGNHIDVVAPGVTVRSTNEAGGYGDFTGTSFAAPYVAGVASLLFADNSDLNADDVEQLIRRSADRTGGFSPEYGMGKVNAARAIALSKAPNRLEHRQVTIHSPTAVGVDFSYPAVLVWGVPGVTPGYYPVRRRELRTGVNHNVAPPFASTPIVWGRGGDALTTGYPRHDEDVRTITNLRYCEQDAGFIATPTGCVLRTYVFEIPEGSDKWYPVRPDGPVTFAWSALEVAPVPDPGNSYYVPEAVVQGVLKDGLSTPKSFSFFRACPNNDGGTSLPWNARVRVVVRDATGAGILGISAADIFGLLNGGTGPGLQGFIGDGADSVIANSQYNDNPLCPNLRAIPADAPTDATGTTYITFTGAGGTRNPSRKWGHHDSELPVYVLGTKIQGRLSDGSAAGSYVLQIKNYDFTNTFGLGTTMNVGEAVTSSEFNYINANMNQTVQDNPLHWWADFNSDGSITSSELTQIQLHVTHDCSVPNSP